MRRITVTQHVYVYFFDDTGFMDYALYDPLNTPLAVTAVKAFAFRVAPASKQVFTRAFACDIFLNAPYQVLRQGYITVFIPFALYDVQQPAIKIKMIQLYIAHFHATKATAI